MLFNAHLGKYGKHQSLLGQQTRFDLGQSVRFGIPELPQQIRGQKTYHNSKERILKHLIGHLRHDVDTREPATITRMRVIPANDVLVSPDLFDRIALS